MELFLHNPGGKIKIAVGLPQPLTPSPTRRRGIKIRLEINFN
jgi:hypothetical protein